MPDQPPRFNGLACDVGNIFRLSDAKSRSISPENFTGEKGKAAMATDGPSARAARDLGIGWKISPWINIKGGETATLADIEGSGAIQHIWMTPAGVPWRSAILRIYWDGEETPSVECPLGDFFAAGWATREDFKQVNSAVVTVNPGSAFNCYWPMPFRKRCKVTIENRNDAQMSVYYSIDYALAEVPDDAAYFHAQFRRVNPLPYKDVYTIVDGIKGKGHYVGTYMAWGVNNSGWWGEGEFKAYIDGDTDFPTIAGTGTEDYFCGSYNFENLTTKQYVEFSTPVRRHATGDSAPTVSTNRSSDSVCIAGTSLTRSASTLISDLRFKPSVGGCQAIASCRCKTTSHRWRFGIKVIRTRLSRSCPIATTVRFCDVRGLRGAYRRPAA